MQDSGRVQSAQYATANARLSLPSPPERARRPVKRRTLFLLLTALLTPAACFAADTNPCLPFTMPSADTVLNSPKKVFAHYFYPFPLSLDNLPSANDYYTVNYLNPHGENNKFVTEGGFLRARPLPVPAKSASNYRLLNMEQEVRMAIARGINGFTFDIMSTNDAAAGGTLPMMLQAAQAVDPRFKIVLMPDMTTLGANTSAVATIIKAVYTSPALYHLSDGRLVLSPFGSQVVSPSGWSAMLSSLKAQGINIAFLPTFTGLNQYISQYAGISVGLGDWGGLGTPDQLSWALGNASAVRATKASIFLDGITPQSYRPYASVYAEAYNSLAYRNAWAGAIQTKADIVHIATWNDYSESGHVAPAVNVYGDSGDGFYNLTGYYSTWYLTGVQPAITHDVLYYFYRKESYRASAPAQSPMTMFYAQTPQDQIEAVAFLTAPGTISINIGGKTYTQSAPAGITSFTVPLAEGRPFIQLVRNGSTVINGTSTTLIHPITGLASGVLDLTYWSGSASSAGVCQISMQ